MKTVNIQAAKTHLSRLVEEALAGEEIVLAKAGHPLVKLTPFTPPSRRRTLGRLKGMVREQAHCWDPDPSIAEAFSNGPLQPIDP
jgi:antitoxin (DNA-binding transcriptional repressor) of toxin-antitoxin stability system